MKFATAPVNWNNSDVPNYREWTPYPQLIDEMTKAGYTVTEWGMNMSTDPKQMGKDLKARGLDMLGGFVRLELRNPAKRKEEIAHGLKIGRFFQSIGGEYLIAADSGDDRRQQEAGHIDPAGELTNEGWRSLGDGLNELGQLLGREGVQLVFHNHVGTYVETEAETERLLEVTDPNHVSWCLDCGHLAYAGGNTLRMLKMYGNRVGYVHLKDVDGDVFHRSRAGNWSFTEALKRFIFTPLGDGIAEVPAVLGALKQSGYNGWLVIEQDPTPLDPTENARRNRIHLERLLGCL
jgi:inosose dehydratase